MLTIASLVLDFGKVNRATFHQDGVTPESDTTHTVMLGLIAIDIAAKHPDLRLDVGLVAQLVYVHDLVEAKCGDTNSFAISNEARADKERREAIALGQLKAELRDHPYLLHLLTMYEEQACPEARFICYLDKVMPKLTHALNGGVAFVKMGKKIHDVYEAHDDQAIELQKKYPEFAGTLGSVFNQACWDCEDAYVKRTLTPTSSPPSE